MQMLRSPNQKPEAIPLAVSISVPSDVQNGAFEATITFTEAVSDFVQSDVSLAGTAHTSITAWTTTDNTTYTATITATTSGTVTISVAAQRSHRCREQRKYCRHLKNGDYRC